MNKRAHQWYDDFNRYAGDLYPNRYTPATCSELDYLGTEIQRLAKEKKSTIVAHNYLYPEFHELADMVGDSLGLSRYVQQIKAPRVDFQSVFFMGATAKIICGNATRVFVPDRPDVIGCSLVFGTDYAWIENWKREHPDGILVTYINSDAYTKSISDYVSTSSNTDKIIVQAAREHPGQKILILPDKYLGYVMKAKAVEQGADPNLIQIYQHEFAGQRACCYVHEKINPTDAYEFALLEHPGAELMIHPECGCAASCMLKFHQDKLAGKDTRAYFLSTEGMVRHARQSPAKKFLVATEKGMLYRLRKTLPDKEFLLVAPEAECGFMKACTFGKLYASLLLDQLEIVFCDDCCDPKQPYQDDRVIHIQRSIAAQAKIGIDRMLTII